MKSGIINESVIFVYNNICVNENIYKRNLCSFELLQVKRTTMKYENRNLHSVALFQHSQYL